MDSIFPNMLLPAKLTYQFLGTFARCEYALKSAGYAQGDDSRVDPDWNAFANSIGDQFDDHIDTDFQEATNYLLGQPPKKQVLDDSQLKWREVTVDPNQKKSFNTLLCVRRVRNNLFHGAKVWSQEYSNQGRDVELVKASLVILQHCVMFDQNVKSFYGNSAF